MNDLDPAELSAFLDGELSPARAKEIEALIAADSGVRAAFEQLKRADQRLRSVAEAAAFRPEIHWPAPAGWRAESWLALPLVVVLLAWVTGKLGPLET
jgi:anti-sigma factor RsiW